MEFPDPVIRVAIEPKTKAGQEKMGIALMKLAEEDPTFKTYTDEETGQTIIAGMGELHLEIIVDRLLREFKVEANVGAPQVAYKETIKKAVQQDTKYARQSGGKGQYGHVKIRVEPNESGKGYEFVNEVVGGAHPQGVYPRGGRRYPGRHALRRAGGLSRGGREGHPLRRVLPRGGLLRDGLQDRRLHGLQGGLPEGRSTLLEPIMKVCVIVPEEYMGDVIGDLNSRRGQIQGFEARPGAQQIDAFVPLSEMFGYATDLRSRTRAAASTPWSPATISRSPRTSGIRSSISAWAPAP